MQSEWVQKRFQVFQAKRAKERQQEQWNQNAIASYPARFDGLKVQVAADVDCYNTLFRSVPGCRATIQIGDDAFQVESNDRSIRVSKSEGTTIQVEYTSRSGERGFDCYTVAPDENGHVLYKHGEGPFLDVAGVSESILDAVLCK
jgi:hypothetical protein